MRNIASRITASIIILLMLTSCSLKQTQAYDYNSEIARLESEILGLQEQRTVIIQEIEILKSENDVKSYALTLEIKQSHFSLDISEHLTDSLNVITLDIPVSKAFFDSVAINDKLTESFRVGSMIMKGSFGNWNVSVKDKKVIE